MNEEEKNLETKNSPVIEPDEIILPDSIPDRPEKFEKYSSETYKFDSVTDAASLIPKLVGAMLGLVIGAVIGAFMGLLAGPVGIFVGIAMGAFVGLIVGLVMGTVGWLLIPKFVRVLISVGLILAVLNWLVWKFFHVSLWKELLQYF